MTSTIIADLLGLGLDHRVAEEAARRFPNNPDSAADWAFSHGDQWLTDRPLREAVAASHGSALTRFSLESHRPPVSRASSTVGSDAAVCDEEELREMATDANIVDRGLSEAEPMAPNHDAPVIQRAGPQGISIGDKNPFASSFQRVQDNRQDTAGELGMVLASDPGSSSDSPSTVRAREESGGSSTTAVTAKRARIDDDPPSFPPPSGPPPALPARPVDQEAQDLERAIALSLQDQPPPYEPPPASPMDFASELEEDEDDPETTPRRLEGSPLILRNPVVGDLFAAQVLQVLLGVPQFREALRGLPLDNLADSPMVRRIRFLRDLVTAGDQSDLQYKTVATKMAALFDIDRVQDHASRVTEICTQVMASWQDVATQSGLAHPTSLFLSEVSAWGDDDARHDRGYWVCLNKEIRHKTLVDCISTYFWDDFGHRAFTNLADVLCVAMKRTDRSFGDEGMQPIKFDEEMYADRWLASNRAVVTQIGASESVYKADVKAIKDELEKYTKFRGVEVDELIGTALAHFDKPDVIEKLQAVKSRLATKVDELQARLTEAEQRLANLWSTPELMQHKYVLRGVSFFTGWASASSYVTYIRGDDTWWRISQTDAIQVDFATVLADDTGLYYENGPFLFVYSRDGERTADVMPYLDEDLPNTSPPPPDAPDPPSSGQTAVEADTADAQDSPMDTANGDAAQ